MLSNFDPTMYALYFDPAGGFASRPVLAFDDDDYGYVASPTGELVDPDYYPDFDRIESVEINA